MSDPEIMEGIAGYHHYHIRNPQKHGPVECYCGARVMATQLPWGCWGIQTHIKESWCNECHESWERDSDA